MMKLNKSTKTLTGRIWLWILECDLETGQK